jgi:hypothetical protein
LWSFHQKEEGNVAELFGYSFIHIGIHAVSQTSDFHMHEVKHNSAKRGVMAWIARAARFLTRSWQGTILDKMLSDWAGNEESKIISKVSVNLKIMLHNCPLFFFIHSSFFSSFHWRFGAGLYTCLSSCPINIATIHCIKSPSWSIVKRLLIVKWCRATSPDYSICYLGTVQITPCLCQ